MTDARAIVRQLGKVATELRRAAVWNGSNLAVDTASDDFLFELLCFFHIAMRASSGFDIGVAGKIVLTSGGKKAARWPRKPGKKENFSYLQLSSRLARSAGFQLCPGIKVTDVHGKDRASDVNLLDGDAPPSPTHSHLRACWDAKYTARADSKLPDTAVSDFIFTYMELGKPTPPATWLSKVSAPECRTSGLLTNGRSSTERDAALLAYGVSETHKFPGHPVTRP
jgi:hypothetical protein